MAVFRRVNWALRQIYSALSSFKIKLYYKTNWNNFYFDIFYYIWMMKLCDRKFQFENFI